MSMTLKNIVVGFIHERNREAFLQDWRKPYDLDVYFLTPQEALDLVDPDNKDGSLFKGLKRSIQKHIGGGPSEFLRDIKNMTKDDRLLAFEYHPKEESLDLQKIKTFFKTHNVRQSKYFGQYAVEHLTMDHDHNEEVPAISV